MLLATLGGEGLQSKFDCYIFEKCHWKNLTSLPEKLRFASLTTLINSTNVIIGGEKDAKNLRSSIMSLNDSTWTQVGNLSKPVSRHCTVVVKEDTIYIIGGLTESSPFSEEIITFNPLNSESSTLGVKLTRGRQLHSCARLNENHIIVVGGRDARGALKSGERLNLARTSKKWIQRKNLELPFGISYAHIVTTNPLGIKKNNVLYKLILMKNKIITSSYKYFSFFLMLLTC
jgi:N-acetylneuraminic acid mutarotase